MGRGIETPVGCSFLSSGEVAGVLESSPLAGVVSAASQIITHKASGFLSSVGDQTDFLITADLSYYTGLRKVGGAETDSKQAVRLKQFVRDLNDGINTKRTSLLGFQGVKRYLLPGVVQEIEKARSLGMLLNFCREKKGLIDQVTETKNFRKLRDEKAFKNILAREFERDLNAHAMLFLEILKRQDLHASFLLTCVLGAGKNRIQEANHYYTKFLAPCVDMVLIGEILVQTGEGSTAIQFDEISSLRQDYDAVSSNSREKEIGKRMNILKFRVVTADPHLQLLLRLPLAIAFCGRDMTATLEDEVVHKVPSVTALTPAPAAQKGFFAKLFGW